MSHLTEYPTSTNEVRAPFDIEPLTVRTGAVIRGVKLGGDLPEPVITAIRQALLRHKVIFFRGQNHLDEASHEAFTSRLGTLLPHPARDPLAGTRATLNLDSRDTRSSTWHADLTFLNSFPQISVLRGVTIPPLGGDTLWANTATAYEHLPASLKEFVDRLWAIHSNVFDYSALIPAGSANAEVFHQRLSKREIVETEHPVVNVHPETGERTLLLGHFVRRIVGFNSSDSAHLLAILNNHATADENVVRWRWTQGDVVIWDNRATLHKAVDDYGQTERIVRRVTVAGTRATSVDGRVSLTRSEAAA
ncbi:TPA: TauD/TfdA family dioxygenase [Burkholderia multivorans]|uniref:TauD/TfdA dioxygenase family protein n=1 Tax=Burkholderia multivorans TaxID=87883 RepID=UPI002018D271|nr:TauD/TfdA family dioxygenase [Burkholderia multivorans]MCO1459906.1 TauD/TfdA family dioxygenase [Burkholderia multivorans]UQO21317.1 TauD/TfdA family dioxygenase [Burkholderia multivorans]HEM7842898.1 TauD/TfdA family dioxygenase [Burkholderia multivorans]HEM7908283.1 TauD/TfdA family dioxygenase [Burkholderia multivorans]HEM8539408.1 TauD/TfdA family dioxygenase [Burkholderia multivorans]